MLKKLQDLLFEEDDEDIEEEEEIAEEPAEHTQPVEVPVQEPEPAPIEQPKPQVSVPAEPVVKAEEPVEVRPAMQRIDVTQQIPTVQPQTRREPARTESVFREPEAPKQTSSQFNIKVDERPVQTPSRPKTKPVQKPVRKEERPRSGYQFQPVISPIFGVDEKDMNALKTTTTKISEAQKAKSDQNISPIISPMYGMNQEDKPSSIQKTVRKSNEQEKIMATPASIKAEDDIPDFSLDDILRERDDAFANALNATEETAPLFPDLNLWDEEPESADDATIVIEKPVR